MQGICKTRETIPVSSQIFLLLDVPSTFNGVVSLREGMS